jgi:undecaprenyl-diphosphatase
LANSLDLRILLELNSLIPASHLGAKAFYFPANNALLRSLPILFPLTSLWFSPLANGRRSRMLIGIVTSCLATVFSVWLQSHLHFSVRPFLDPNLHLRGAELVQTEGWNHLGSFPSDTGTLLFALSTVVFLERRFAGIIAYLWSFLVAGVIRVAVGWHYPSDVLGAIVLGCVSVLVVTRIGALRRATNSMLQRMEPHIYIVHSLMFFLLADAMSLFNSGLQFLHGIRDVVQLALRR